MIAADAIDAYRGPERLWPNAADDVADDPDVPYRNVYLGAAGVAWALDLLARDGLAPALPGLDDLLYSLPQGFREAPEFIALALPPAPSLPFGETGILLAVELIRGDGARRDDLDVRPAKRAQPGTRDVLGFARNHARRAEAVAPQRRATMA